MTLGDEEAEKVEPLMYHEVPPLDAFVALNYMRLLVLHCSSKEWKDLNFAGQGERVDEDGHLADYVRSAL